MGQLIDKDQFAVEWVEAWNSHDLDRILSHYSDDIEITTPMIRLAGGGKSDSLKGKEVVRAYWAKALEKIPDLKFELIDSTLGVDSIGLYYHSVMNKRAIEVMSINEEGLIEKMSALYTD
ncbi:nuclear transport factor 2 family protein [Flagellimonas sp. S174]|uniref:nuclear transport factor 2 family protein n=1 Tax=Flagellimonas sp. S174 TaxID=3410790 RepID=UPI003BF605B0